MIVIIDSIDRVGKTTLANKLAEKGYKIYKHSEEGKKYSEMTDEGETSTMLAMLSLYKLYPENKIIFDRFHMSNTAYGILNRNYDKEKAFKNYQKIDDVLSKLDVVLVMVAPVDLERSNREHGKDQTECLKLMNELFAMSNIKRKIITNYNELDTTVEDILNIKGEK